MSESTRLPRDTMAGFLGGELLLGADEKNLMTGTIESGCAEDGHCEGPQRVSVYSNLNLVGGEQKSSTITINARARFISGRANRMIWGGPDPSLWDGRTSLFHLGGAVA
jgi:hypothetical protein